MSKIRVMVADDHLLVRDGICLLINNQPDMQVVAMAGNGEDAWHIARETNPDVLVMDISMPVLSGAQATERLRYCSPDIKILVVSAHGDDAHVRQMLSFGARGYVLKRTASQELAVAIRAVNQGKMYLDSSVTDFSTSPSSKEQLPNSETKPQDTRHPDQLSERDLDVIKLVARGFSNIEISQRMNLSVKTIEGYKAKINAKLGFSSRAELVEYALKRGWLQEGI